MRCTSNKVTFCALFRTRSYNTSTLILTLAHSVSSFRPFRFVFDVPLVFVWFVYFAVFVHGFVVQQEAFLQLGDDEVEELGPRVSDLLGVLLTKDAFPGEVQTLGEDVEVRVLETSHLESNKSKKHMKWMVI